jgi:uncharacterized protein (DUF2147 family)
MEGNVQLLSGRGRGFLSGRNHRPGDITVRSRFAYVVRHRARAVIAAIAAVVALASIVPVGLVAQAPAVRADDILGIWESDTRSLKLRMVKAADGYNAHILWGNRVVEADGTTFKPDTKNPDPALRSRSIQNIVMISGLVWEKDEWTGGTLYDPSSGRSYRCKVAMKNGQLQMRGYMGFSLMGRTVVMNRIGGKP